MGQDYPFNHRLHTNYGHHFFAAKFPEDIGDLDDALSAICEHSFDCDPELGRITIFSDADAAKLMKLNSLDDQYTACAIRYVPRKLSLSQISLEIRKEYRQFDIQTNYRIIEDEDGIFCLTGRIFITPFPGEEFDLKPIGEEIKNTFGDRGVSVTYYSGHPTLLDLYVDGG